MKSRQNIEEAHIFVENDMLTMTSVPGGEVVKYRIRTRGAGP